MEPSDGAAKTADTAKTTDTSITAETAKTAETAGNAENAKKIRRLTLLRLFWIFFKAGTFTFSGGLAMLPLIQKDVIEKYKMLDKDTFLDYAALSQTLPGIISLNCGIFVGRTVAGIAGAAAAGFGVVLPAFVTMLAATILLEFIPRTGVVESVFAGVRSASAALILYSAISLGSRNFKKPFPVIMIAIAFVSVLFFNVSAFFVILFAAFSGLAFHLNKVRKTPPEAIENAAAAKNATAAENAAAGKTAAADKEKTAGKTDDLDGGGGDWD